MDNIDKKIYELIVEVNSQIEYLNKIKNKFNGSENLKAYEFTILNFVSRSKNNLKGLKILLEQLIYDDFLLIPISSIMRTISSDGLSLTYLMSYLSENLKEEQNTFINELNAISIEHHQLLKELGIGTKNPNFYDGNLDKLKKRLDFHLNSDEKITGDKSKLPNNIFLSEKDKIKRIKKSVDESLGIFEIIETKDLEIMSKIETIYFSNKWFSQYYHYNHLNSKFSINKSREIMLCEIIEISKCLNSVFLLLNFFSSCLD